MTMTDEELIKHIDIAKSATPGPWNQYIGLDEDCAVWQGEPGTRDYRLADNIESMHDAEHIAANFPEVVMELCAELLFLRKEKNFIEFQLQEMKNEISKQRDELAKYGIP